MTDRPLGDPECDRCDDSELDPDAYTAEDTPLGIHYRPEPCRNCQPEEPQR